MDIRDVPAPGAGLTVGRRVCLNLTDDASLVAQIEELSGEVLKLRILDELPEDGGGSVRSIMATDEGGLRIWPAVSLPGEHEGNWLVALSGPGTALQRRRDPRFGVNLTATVTRFTDETVATVGRASVVDVSRGGMKLVGPALSVRDVVLARIETAAGQLDAMGRVVLSYQDGNGRGVAHVALLEAADSSDSAPGIGRILDDLDSAVPPSRR